MAEQVNDISSRGKRHKDQECTPPAQSICHPAAGILVNRIEEVFRGSKQPNHSRTCAKCFEILWQELLPELFTKSENEDCRRSQGDIPLKAQKVCNLASQTHRLIDIDSAIHSS